METDMIDVKRLKEMTRETCIDNFRKVTENFFYTEYVENVVNQIQLRDDNFLIESVDRIEREYKENAIKVLASDSLYSEYLAKEDMEQIVSESLKTILFSSVYIAERYKK
jgi:hypothetical protein